MIVSPDAENKVARGSLALRYTWAGVIVFVGIVITLSGFVFTQHWGEDKAEHVFNEVTTGYATAVQETLALQLDALDSIEYFYAASQFVSRGEFQTFANGLLKTRSAIQAWSGSPALRRRHGKIMRRGRAKMGSRTTPSPRGMPLGT